MAFKLPAMAPAGLWRRTPPAIFPPILGLLGLALAWRRGAGEFGVPQGAADMLMGAVTLLFIFSTITYVAKLMRRPAVVNDDLKVLPGRAGLAAGVLCLYLFAGALTPFSAEQARPVLILGLAVHLVLALLLVRLFITGPAEQRRVTPVWHLSFTGFIVAAMVAQGLGLSGLTWGLFWLSLLVAVLIWVISADQFRRLRVPAPLRPLLAIHLAPASLLGVVALGMGMPGLALGFGVLSVLLLAAMVLGVRWLLAAGFSPLWGALTFPLAATANFWVALGGAWRIPGGILLVLATLIIVPIAVQVLKLWAKGQLAVKTNAAIA
ncbi:tellurium resistance protein [Phaeovulum sp.]|uniref:SLAC1 family transporter n=1 Tax=Phaeovulum sp. TaxID=2934796 RepID=UPI0039E2EAFB